MKNMEQARKDRLIREAHSLLDRIEANMKHIFDSLKAKSKKVA